jgi:PAS domain S-box-containing protein
MGFSERRALGASTRNNTATCDHFVQFYEDDAVLVEAVTAFIGASLASGSATIVVATDAHRAAIETALTARGLDLSAFRTSGHYLAFDAASTLETILLEGWPDAQRFLTQCEPMLEKAETASSTVAIFAEMVALLWGEGKHGAAVHLEHLWNELASRHSFGLFCAYPIAEIASGTSEAMNEICDQHSRAIPSESYSHLETSEERLAEVCKLQQRARMLEREIRRRKAIERALAARERELTDFLENAPQAMHSVGPDGRILWANQFELDLLGYTAAEYIGHPITEFHVDAEEGGAILERLREGRTLTEEFARIRCKDGSVRDVLITSNVQWEDGEFIYSRCLMRDVTDQKRTERVLHEIEERAEQTRALLAAIVESSDDAIVSKSLDSRINSWNEGAVRLFGYSANEVIGKPITIIIPRELQHEEQEILAKITKGERIEHFETVRVAKDGRRIDVSLTISPIFDRRGQVIGVSKSARDISERKRMEEMLRAADRRKDEFLAMLGHELRNPLAPIRNVVEVLRRTAGSDPVHEPLYEMLDRQVRQMTRLLDDLLDVARIRQGKIKFQHEAIDFQTVVARAVEATAPTVEARRHHLSISMPQDELPIVGDLARLVQMLTNLLNNAAKYTPEGGTISLTVRRADETVELRVKDNGVGIAAEMLPRVFDLFVQADHTLRQSQDGMGIGLTLVRNILEHHAGTVRAVSEGAGRGSEFIVSLPLADRAAIAAVRPAVLPEKPSAPTASRRILLVDDNRDLSESLATLLRLNGHDVAVASDGISALQMIDKRPPDVALIDIGLPGMNGYQLAHRLRASGCPARLIAVTGYGGREERQRSLDAGFDDHFVKPIDTVVLDQIIYSDPEGAVGTASD